MNKKTVTNRMFKDACTAAQEKHGLTQVELAFRLSISKATLQRLQKNGSVDIDVYAKLIALVSGSSHKTISNMLYDVLASFFPAKEKDS